MVFLVKKLVLLVIATFLFIPLSTFAAVKKFNYDNILIESLRLNNITDFKPLAEEWLLYSDKQTYHKYKNDEFEFQDKVEEAGKKLKTLVEKAPPSPEFTILVDTQFGEYDFEKNQFTYQPLMNGHLYIDGGLITHYTKTLPRRINLYVSNPEVIDGIQMPKAEAKKFIQHRKDQFGNINRNVVLSVNIQFNSADGLDNLTGTVLSYTLKDKDNKIIYSKKLMDNAQ
ncbi:DUF4852 domain-containing protein [Avibacterium avium]|uniref:DUF4852 domain-containing protein n=1 Tax=Avibacterium avium TaxID=751 RepID=UPI003BF8519E